MNRFLAVWPIVDDTIPLPDLIAEATADLPAVAMRANAQLVSRPSWSVRPGSAVPGSGGAATVLVCEARAVRCRRPSDIIREAVAC